VLSYIGDWNCSASKKDPTGITLDDMEVHYTQLHTSIYQYQYQYIQCSITPSCSRFVLRRLVVSEIATHSKGEVIAPVPRVIACCPLQPRSSLCNLPPT
jgi:hypothetical protein